MINICDMLLQLACTELAVLVSAGNVVVHALDEKARTYYDLEGLWSKGTAPKESEQVDLGVFLVKEQVNYVQDLVLCHVCDLLVMLSCGTLTCAK